MNYPIWEIPAPGLLVAVVAILHVVVSHFAVGGGLFLVLAERRARREGDAAFLGWLEKHSRFFILLTLVFGAMTGVGIWFTIALVSPQGTSSLINTFVWGWAIEWTLFLVEIAAAMVYYYGWDRLTAKTHMIVGWIYFVTAWASLAVINGILSYMLTPGRWIENRAFWSGFFNETYLPSLVMRTFVCAGLAGVYALLTAAWLTDADLKSRIARYAGLRWILPMAVAVPASLVWYLAAAMQAGVPAGEILGARSERIGAILAAIFVGKRQTGYPLAQSMILAALAAAILVAALTLFLVVFRPRTFGKVSVLVLLGLSLVALGGGEWVREDLRKPYLIGRYMFVNATRLPSPAGVPAPPADAAHQAVDPFSIDALHETGVLTVSPWARVPEAWSSVGRVRDPVARAAIEAEAGREVFKLLCTHCHTLRGHLGIAQLVRGRTVAALDRVIDQLAQPVGPDGRPAPWSDPRLRMATWLGRRMPPFAGNAAERRAMAVYLARVGGTPDAGTGPESAEHLGERVYQDKCAICHDAGSDAPMARMIKGRSADALHAVIGRLHEISEAMPPFDGTDEERRALADFLAEGEAPRRGGEAGR